MGDKPNKPSKSAQELLTAMQLMGVGLEVDDDHQLPKPPTDETPTQAPEPKREELPTIEPGVDSELVPTATGLRDGDTTARISFELPLRDRFAFRKIAAAGGWSVRDALHAYVRACNAAGEILVKETE
jgi:hypothetical protein